MYEEFITNKLKIDLDKEMKELGFDVSSALEFSKKGRIEEWVHKYCTAGSWDNPELSKGLKLIKRWWNGPVEIEISGIKRSVGPEPGKNYEVSEEYWTKRIALMSESFNDPLTIPPLIVEYKHGELHLADGNTRCGTMEYLGWKKFWVIIWYNSEKDHVDHSKYLKDRGVLCST